MLAGTNSDFIRAYNRRVIMELIRRKGTVSRSDVARKMGLTLQAVSTIFTDLSDEGWIIEVGRRTIARGQPPVEYSLNPDTAVSLGITLDLDGITAAAVDLSGRVLKRTRTEATRPGPGETVRIIKESVLELTQATTVKGRGVLGIGIAIPGTPDADTGFVTMLPHIPGWEGVQLREELVSTLAYPIHIANDAIVAGLGESWFGSSERSRNAFYILFAHGLNGAMLSNQRPYGGIWGVTGKFGHIPVEADGKDCGACGGKGCVERYASLLSLLEVLDRDVLNTKELKVLLASRDKTLESWIEQATAHLTTALVSVENLFDPDVIIFGGLLPKALLRRLVRNIEEVIASRRMKIKTTHPTYALATFASDASLIGAATLPMYLEITPDMDLVFEQTLRG